MLAMGIGIIIVSQAMLHMYISVGNFVTGQPLPLISQGGTSVIINCIYIGFLLSISQYANKNEDKKEDKKNV
jgi:cell division protein FtsW